MNILSDFMAFNWTGAAIQMDSDQNVMAFVACVVITTDWHFWNEEQEEEEDEEKRNEIVVVLFISEIGKSNLKGHNSNKNGTEKRK